MKGWLEISVTLLLLFRIVLDEPHRNKFAIFLLSLVVCGCSSTPRPETHIETPPPLATGDCVRIVFLNRNVPEIRQTIDAAGNIQIP